MKNKEIEVKFKIAEGTYQKVVADLDVCAIKTAESRLVDTYYIPDFREFEIDGVTQECVRIRQDEKGNTVCYKKIHYEANPVYCDEFETKVEDKDQLENILFRLGFSVQMVIDKTRVSYKTDKFEFDIDYVKDLGYLFEVELKQDGADIDEIFKFVEPYGLTKDDVTYEGIQILMKKAMAEKSKN